MPKKRQHGSGSLYQRGKTWWIAYYDHGKQVCESTKTTNKAEARSKLNERLGEIAKGEFIGPASERLTFAQLTELVVTDYKVNGKRTLNKVEQRLRNHLTPFFSGKKARGITAADVQDYIAHRQDEEASNGTINRELILIKRAFNLALRAELLTKKPYIPNLTEDNVRQGFFERWQFEAVLAKLPEYLRPPLTLAYTVGWRFTAEVVPLRWEQVDLAEGTVRLEPGSTKNKDARPIFLPSELRAVLEVQWQDHQTHFPDCPLVFHNHGKRITSSYYRAWYRACKEAGIQGKIPHDFRRTAVRNMVRAGIPERVAMQISGHKSRTIFDRYHIVSDGDLKEAARKLESPMPAQPTTKTTTLPLTGEQESLVTH